jgi:hypothetical protein
VFEHGLSLKKKNLQSAPGSLPVCCQKRHRLCNLWDKLPCVNP